MYNLNWTKTLGFAVLAIGLVVSSSVRADEATKDSATTTETTSEVTPTEAVKTETTTTKTKETSKVAKEPKAPKAPKVAKEPKAPKATKEVTKLEKKDIVVGKGAEAKSGLKVTVHYTGWLTNGKKFDSSKDRNEPFSFTLGGHQVIEGWDQGVAGMKVGGKRKLTIPASMGYGDRGAGELIPPNSTLVFEVELLGVG